MPDLFLSREAIGLLGIAFLIVLIMSRIPVGIALGLSGFLGYATLEGFPRALSAIGSLPLDLSRNYSLTVLPLFILMGVVATQSNMARELFDSANKLFSGLRGSLAMASVGTCATFGAISGSSIAIAASISRIAVPEMERHGYDNKISVATVASAGTLGILIPPSVILVVYAIIAEESVPALFAAGILPGIVLTILHIIAIVIIGRMRPESIPLVPGYPLRDRLIALKGFWKIGVLFLVTVGGIYLGWFSPTEAAAVGALLTILLGFATRQLAVSNLLEAFRESVRTTAMIALLIMAGYIFSYFMVFSHIPASLGGWIKSSELSPFVVVLCVVLLYLVLGMFLDSISMMLITVPVFLPIFVTLGFDKIWFGIFVVVMAEIGLITPPVGMNIFVIKSQLPHIPIQTMFAGIMPFVFLNLILVLLLVLFPQLALWLPRILT